MQLAADLAWPLVALLLGGGALALGWRFVGRIDDARFKELREDLAADLTEHQARIDDLNVRVNKLNLNQAGM